EEIFQSLIEQYYQNAKFILPDVIITPILYDGINLLKDLLNDFKEGIQIRKPKDEKEEGILRIATKNAKVMVNQQIQMEQIKNEEQGHIESTLQEAKELLNLPGEPRIIEGFDISNIEGTDATGSTVVFLNGKPYTRDYRHYKIRSKSTPDDVGMMKEVMERRYSARIATDKPLPDLILVDGGKGQLNAAFSVLEDLGIENIPIIGLAKRLEEIFLVGKKESIILPQDSSILKLFQNVRDEAHRFAVRLHKKQREKRIVGSILDTINGIGPVTRNKLLQHFGSVENIKNTSLEELSKVVNKKVAEAIKKNLK
ncbi:MAG: excinuclease ABC subunit C, partial [Promethearchaeota archaeon]